MKTALQALVVAIVTGAIYFPNLGLSPPHLFHDEVKFALQAQSIATTGRDINGRFMPVYFSEPEFTAGRDPLPIYLTALVLKVLPLSESSVRLPSAIVGVASVVLTFLVARLIFGRDVLAFVAAGILALTPTHFIHSRLGLSVLYPLPFVLAWLWGLAAYLIRPRLRVIFAACLALGSGVYGYLAAVVMMPVYFMATMVLMLRRRAVRPALIATAGFVLPLVFLVAWQVAHPERYRELIQSYRLYDSTRMSPLQGVKDLTSYFSIGERTNVYWQAFNPGMLFVTGESSIIDSTRQVGSFLLPIAILLPIGIVHILRRRRTQIGLFLLLGLATAPLPAVLVAQGDIRRWLVIVPFVALISTFGVEYLWQNGRLAARVAVAMLLLVMPLQFRTFYQDYTTDYRLRASPWFGGNIRGAIERAIEGNPSVVYLSDRIPYGDAYWTFYCEMFRRDDLLHRAVFITPGQGAAPVAANARLIIAAIELEALQPWLPAGWEKSADIYDPRGEISFIVFSSQN